MGNPQTEKFISISQFLSSLPQEEYQLVCFLRNLIFENLPNVKEKLAYNVPFYYIHTRLFYIWPASIPWGNVKNGVAFGFCQADKMVDLDTTDTKVVGKWIFTDMNTIDVPLLKVKIFEAVAVDAQLVKAKRKKIQ